MSVHSKNVQDPPYIYSGYKEYLQIIVFIVAFTHCLIKCEYNFVSFSTYHVSVTKISFYENGVYSNRKKEMVLIIIHDAMKRETSYYI